MTELGDPLGVRLQALQLSRACHGLAERSTAPAYPTAAWIRVDSQPYLYGLIAQRGPVLANLAQDWRKKRARVAQAVRRHGRLGPQGSVLQWMPCADYGVVGLQLRACHQPKTTSARTASLRASSLKSCLRPQPTTQALSKLPSLVRLLARKGSGVGFLEAM